MVSSDTRGRKEMDGNTDHSEGIFLIEGKPGKSKVVNGRDRMEKDDLEEDEMQDFGGPSKRAKNDTEVAGKKEEEMEEEGMEEEGF